jgi:hypothetical protein
MYHVSVDGGSLGKCVNISVLILPLHRNGPRSCKQILWITIGCLNEFTDLTRLINTYQCEDQYYNINGDSDW